MHHKRHATGDAPAVVRLDPTRCRIDNPQGVPVTLYANPDVPIEEAGVAELLSFLSLQDTLRRLYDDGRAGRAPALFGDGDGDGEPPALGPVVLTPDFHKGAGIPVGTVARTSGFVVPAAIGNDICCGMRLLATDVTRDELAGVLARPGNPLLSRLRAIFFGGERDIPLSPRQREALLRGGLPALHEARADNAGTGLWRYYDPLQQEADLLRVHFGGGLPTSGVFAFADYIRGSGQSDGRDAQIGALGGGNHFVELQGVTDLLDGPSARHFGLVRGGVTLMVHTGSVGLGHGVGGHFTDRARALYPRGVAHPDHGFYVLPTSGPHRREAEQYLDAMRNAANFAFGNRLWLGLMAQRALSEVLGRRVSARLVYDAPHNLIWEEAGGTFLHRKGACPAPGPDPDRAARSAAVIDSQGPFAYTGHPVIIPGSMGAASYVLAGAGLEDALQSACHGAGRSLTRGQSQHVDQAVYEEALQPLRVVTPLDPDAPAVRLRRDILAKHHQRLKEEAPYAYKPITPVVETVEQAGIARRVARLWPLVTVKG